MATSSLQLKSQSFKIKGAFAEDLLVFTAARVNEGLSQITEIRLEFVTQDTAFKPEDILGTRMALIMSDKHRYVGMCISVENLGTIAGYNRFAAELRPWLWFMTLGSENRIFQSMKTPEILAKLFKDAGFTDLTQRLGGTYDVREYCVQYQESNFDFVSRLMEEEGIYYYFDHSGEVEKLVLADAVSSHDVAGSYKFKNRVEKTRVEIDTVFEWAPCRYPRDPVGAPFAQIL